jgi:hypothetical protein
MCRELFKRPLILLTVMFFSQVLLAESVEEEIEFLIARVQSSDCVFVRNGDAHSPDDAADHLRLKYRRGKRYATSAENFIDRLASESSWTGKPYFINCPDTGEHTAKAWFSEELRRFRQDRAL